MPTAAHPDAGDVPPPARRILFTGDYDPLYNRTLVITQGLAKLGVEVVHFPFASKRRRVARRLAELGRAADFVFLPCFTHQQVAFVKAHLPALPLIFDPLVSRYMTRVLDYRDVSRYSIRALHNWLKDKIALSRADLVVCDTLAHAAYFHDKYRIDAAKFRLVPVGVNTEQFRPNAPAQPLRKPGDPLLVGFYGGFIPLQGAQAIVDAARLLQPHADIAFELVGTGFEYKGILRQLERRPLERMVLPGWVPQEDLNRHINAYDICLGIFGTGPKADLVVPNKVYHYAACGKPIVTKDSPAIREVFTDSADIALVAPRAEALAAAILALKNDPERCLRLGSAARRLMERDYNEVRIAERLLAAYRDLRAGLCAPLAGLESPREPGQGPGCGVDRRE
ncbi:MAG: glycosyltransferase [SAR324 cluster bacterium]